MNPPRAYARSTGPAGLSWPRVVVRMLLVVLPGQLLGFFLGVTALSVSGVLRDRPGLSILMLVTAGLVAGLGLGLLVRPDREQRVPYAVVGAAVAAAVFVLLLGLSQLRLPAISPHAGIGDFGLGALLVVVAQSAVAVPLWWQRTRALA